MYQGGEERLKSVSGRGDWEVKKCIKEGEVRDYKEYWEGKSGRLKNVSKREK